MPSHGQRSASLLASAVSHHQAGRLADAERGYREILARDPNHADALHFLGVLAHQVGRNDAAVDLIGRALARNPRNPVCHYNLGLAFRALGRLDDVIAHNRQAIALKPDYAEAHMNLGNALKQQGKLEDAAASFRRALAIRSDAAEVHYNLGNVLADLSNFVEAEASYRRALALKSSYAEAENNLGTALIGQGRIEEALQRHARAVELNPDLVQAHINLGNAYMMLGGHQSALASYRRAIALQPNSSEAYANAALALLHAGQPDEAASHFERALAFVDQNLQTKDAKALFIKCVRHSPALPDGEEFEGMLARALSENWTRPVMIAAQAARLIVRAGAVADYVSRANAAWPRRLDLAELFGTSGLAAVAGNKLLLSLLRATHIPNFELERFLTVARGALLAVASSAHPASSGPEGVLGFVCALARQCFINEYVFSCTPEETGQVTRLRDTLVASLESNRDIPAFWVALLAAYVPLHSLSGAQRLLDRSWPAPMDDLLAQQIREPLEEARYRTEIPRLTAIESDVSIKVREQYEENPYPRWSATGPIASHTSVESSLRAAFPWAQIERSQESERIEILIAGCGSGQHSIETALRFPKARLLAVDLSLASLAYAKRKTVECGVSNIEYAQADILGLGSIGRTFDVIESSGVLHHMADPMEGWRILLSLLRSGGFMRVGLYSEIARRDVVKARQLIAQRGYVPRLEDIRGFREELVAGKTGIPLQELTRTADFFSTSTFRDLLFHVQEHRFTLSDIDHFLKDNGLGFIAFDTDIAVVAKYRRRYPADARMTDLGHWHQFETENPDTFFGMYQFWAQKRV
jgi:tetratricopeptide (TPR) repeat protein/SAM-dependent methyltransferase